MHEAGGWSPPPKKLRHRVRDVATQVFWWGLKERGLPPADSLTIVTLHRFLPAELRRQYVWPHLAVTPQAFGRMARFFADYFDVRPVSEALDLLERGRSARARPLLAITADDGQWDNYAYALPVLNRLGLKATFYIPTNAVDARTLLWPDQLGLALRSLTERGVDLAPLWEMAKSPAQPNAGELVEAAKRISPDERQALLARADELAAPLPAPPDWGRLMTWDEIREVAAAGHEIGGHSRSHPILPLLDDDDLEDEIAGCYRRLREELPDTALRSFAYPNGDTDDRVCAVAEAAGFDHAVTCDEHVNLPGPSRFRLGRFDMNQELSQGAFGHVDAATLSFRIGSLRPRLSRALRRA